MALDERAHSLSRVLFSVFFFRAPGRAASGGALGTLLAGIPQVDETKARVDRWNDNLVAAERISSTCCEPELCQKTA